MRALALISFAVILAGALIGFFGDSSLFIDPRDLSMFVIDPTGAIARVAAVPRSQDAASMGSKS